MDLTPTLEFLSMHAQSLVNRGNWGLNAVGVDTQGVIEDGREFRRDTFRFEFRTIFRQECELENNQRPNHEHSDLAQSCPLQW